MRNVYIIGAQCTGKTTLVNALDAAFAKDAQRHHPQHPAIIREVAREVLKEKDFSRDDITTSPERALQLQKHILDAQHDAEIAASAGNLGPGYICDRSGLDPIVYADLLVGHESSTELLASKAWFELESRMKEAIVILCEAGCHWLTDDGMRLMPTDVEDWGRVDGAFRDLLKARGIGYSVISKDLVDLDKRVGYVRSLINASQRRDG
jgi:nicotinamide riboside kinase